MNNKNNSQQKSKNTFSEDYLFHNTFTKPIVLVTYDGNVLIEEKVKVLVFDIQADTDKYIKKLEILFAFPLEKFEAIKDGIFMNEEIAAQKLKSVLKRSDRPDVVSDKDYEKGTKKNVSITMRTGHVLSGYQVNATKYYLIVRVCGKVVLVYKHGILEYSISNGTAEIG